MSPYISEDFINYFIGASCDFDLLHPLVSFCMTGAFICKLTYAMKASLACFAEFIYAFGLPQPLLMYII